MTSASVVVVVPVHNRRELTLGFLRSLEVIDRSGLEVAVIVVDDGSTDGTGEAVRAEHPEVRVIDADGSLHYSEGTNVGIRAALEQRPDFVLTMNDDAVVPVDLIGRLVTTARAEPRSVVGAVLVEWDDASTVFQIDPRWSLRYGGFQHRRSLTVADLPSTPFEVETMAGNCMLLPRAALEEVGLQPSARLPFWGDAGIARRLRGAGWRLLIDPTAVLPCEPNQFPAPLHTVGARRALRSLFVDDRHPLHLGRQFWVRWETAPSRLAGGAAFVVYLWRLGLKTVSLGGSWPGWPDPPDPFRSPPPVRGGRRTPIR